MRGDLGVDAESTGATPAKRAEWPALAEWYRELAECQRTATTFDELWRAACFESEAREADAAGLLGVAANLQTDARRIIAAALKNA